MNFTDAVAADYKFVEFIIRGLPLIIKFLQRMHPSHDHLVRCVGYQGVNLSYCIPVTAGVVVLGNG